MSFRRDREKPQKIKRLGHGYVTPCPDCGSMMAKPGAGQVAQCPGCSSRFTRHDGGLARVDTAA